MKRHPKLDDETKRLARTLRGQAKQASSAPRTRRKRLGRPPNKPPSDDHMQERGYRRQRDRERIRRRAILAAANQHDIFPEVTNIEQRCFLVAFCETGNKKEAARSVGIPVTRTNTRRWLTDPIYIQALRQAEETAADLLESEAYRRAVKGWLEPVGWYQGYAGGTVRKYSDLLLIVLLKGLRPDKYKDRVELKGLLGALDWNKLPHEAIDRLANGEHPFTVLASLAQQGAEKLGLDLSVVKGALPRGSATMPEEQPIDIGSSGGGEEGV